jgi:hypothetical protein
MARRSASARGRRADGRFRRLAHDGGGNGNGNGTARSRSTIFTMPTADGQPEGVAFDKKSGRFFVSRTGTGAIFVRDARQRRRSSRSSRAASRDAPLATGLKVRKGLLYVAGASTGQIRVYDLANPAKAPIVFETGGGFINDLDLDPTATSSRRLDEVRSIYMVSAARVKAGAGAVEAIDVGPESRAIRPRVQPQRHRRRRTTTS